MLGYSDLPTVLVTLFLQPFECGRFGVAKAAYSTWSNPMPDTLLTTEQVAQYLKVDKFTIYRLVTQRKLPAYKVGNQWRFNKKLIDKWLRQNMNIPYTSKTQ